MICVVVNQCIPSMASMASIFCFRTGSPTYELFAEKIDQMIRSDTTEHVVLLLRNARLYILKNSYATRRLLVHCLRIPVGRRDLQIFQHDMWECLDIFFVSNFSKDLSNKNFGYRIHASSSTMGRWVRACRSDVAKSKVVWTCTTQYLANVVRRCGEWC